MEESCVIKDEQANAMYEGKWHIIIIKVNTNMEHLKENEELIAKPSLEGRIHILETISNVK